MQFSTFFLAALSLGSAIASPVVGFVPFTEAHKAVSQAKIVVEQQLIQIKLLTTGTPDIKTVAKVQSSLLIIGQSVNSLVLPAVALSSYGPIPLSKDQYATLSVFQEDFLNIIVDLELIGKRITGSNLDKNAISKVKPQLQWALSPVGAISQSIVTFVDVAAPKYATYKHWTPYLVNIQALIVVGLAKIALYLGINISIL
ncbi:hypothetical protein GQX73_g6182 [Xylaria multiplex]|uniref:Uncharacterized protein n=1 Tax=Xylaria multiplex TaxID=323545 RepID=A0A7C8MS52_9PEZI|nr:hypothetical protein GQX73_g6182 [Xylaria multiplex]